MRTWWSKFHGTAAPAAVLLSLLGTFSAVPLAVSSPGTPAPLQAARFGQTATALSDGRIVIIGGEDGLARTATIEIYDPATGAWSVGTPMPAVRTRHAATRLLDGRVLVTGGTSDAGLPLGSAEIYDPVANAWTAAAAMQTPRYGHTAVSLANGTVLVCGGFILNPGGTAESSAACEMLDPSLATSTWMAAAPMLNPRGVHSATRLADGRMLVVGGYGPSGSVATVEIFDPVAGAWVNGAPAAARAEHAAALLPDGRVLVAGGVAASGYPAAVAELYDSSTNTWVPTAPLAQIRAAHASAVLPSGDVLVAGGHDGSVTTSSTEIWSLPATPRPTTTAITNASPATSAYGNPVTLTARVEATDATPAGGVEFFDNGVSLGQPVPLQSGQAALTTSSISVNNRLTAVYRPTGLFAASTSAVFPLTVTKTPATATLMFSKSPQQYSDLETFEATMSPAVPGLVIAGSVTFKVGTQEMGVAPLLLEGAVYKARLTAPLIETVPGQMMPTSPFGRTATAVMNAPNFQVANATRALVITKEDGRATYDGTLSALTSGTGATDAAIVTLRATIKDITAAEPGQDANAGDIRGAYVQFYNRETSLAISPALPVALVNPGDTTTGFVSYNWTPTIGLANSQTFRVGIMLGTYYLRNSSAEDVLVTVSKPLAARFISGGGALTLATSAGTQAGDAGSVNGFGVSVKYNGNGSSPSGQFHTIVRSAGKVFHLKSTTLTSLVVAGNTATLKGTASIYDITNGSLLALSNATFEVRLADNGAGMTDTIWMSIRTGTGAVWFSSTAAGTPQVLSGGDILMR